MNQTEGVHFVTCRHCGTQLSHIVVPHLKRCGSGLTVRTYRQKYPGAPLHAKEPVRAQSEERRQAQSEKLRTRFRTPEGEVTKQQIAAASRTMQAGEYRQEAVAHLLNLNQDPNQRARAKRQSLARWADGTQAQKTKAWRDANPEQVAASAANARRHLPQKDTKPHAKLREALRRAGVVTVTEYEVGYYAIDEAIPDRKVAIECDGCYFHGCSTCGFPGIRENQVLDRRKNTYLERRGWTVLRFPACRIDRDADGCVVEVSGWLDDRLVRASLVH